MRRLLFWLVLALPGAFMLRGVLTGTALPVDLLHPSGEFSLRLMILAMLAGPLADYFGRNRFFLGWIAIRRNLGVAGFAYGLLHLVFYALDLGTLAAMIDEVTLPAIWTGWLALALMMAAASISMDRAVRALGAVRWKRIQQGVYAALILALLHWGLIDRNWGPALAHLAPLIIAWSLRFIAHRKRATARERITP